MRQEVLLLQNKWKDTTTGSTETVSQRENQATGNELSSKMLF